MLQQVLKLFQEEQLLQMLFAPYLVVFQIEFVFVNHLLILRLRLRLPLNQMLIDSAMPIANYYLMLNDLLMLKPIQMQTLTQRSRLIQKQILIQRLMSTQM